MTEKPYSALTGYPALEVNAKTGNEQFSQKGKPIEITLLDFWRWSASDLANNTLRGKLAEYIVAQALCNVPPVRVEWQPYDLLTISGLRIEVKSAAYLQTWYHSKLSSISFGIQPTIGWNSATNTYETTVKRQADLYVFCLLSHQDKNTLDPLNLDQWEFYVLPTSILNQACPTQKKISLTRVLHLGAKPLTFDELALVINSFTD